MLRRALLPLLLAALLASCGEQPQPMPGGAGMIEPPPGGFDYQLELQREGLMSGHIGGVRVEIERDLVLEEPMRSKATAYKIQGVGEPRMQLRGAPLLIEGGRVRIGERDYGKVADGQLVRIGQDGVRVQGELRGQLP